MAETYEDVAMEVPSPPDNGNKVYKVYENNQQKCDRSNRLFILIIIKRTTNCIMINILYK